VASYGERAGQTDVAASGTTCNVIFPDSTNWTTCALILQDRIENMMRARYSLPDRDEPQVEP